MRVHRHAITEPGDWRGWWNLYRDETEGIVELSVQLNRRWKSSYIATVEIGGQEDPIEFCIAVPRLFFVHLGINGRWLFRHLSFRPPILGYEGREFGLKFNDGRLRVLVGAPDHGSTSEPRFAWTWPLRVGGRRGRNRRRTFRPYPIGDHSPWLAGHEFSITLDPRDLIGGRRKRLSHEVVYEEPATVPMPEGEYPCTVKLEQSVWGRPRWRWNREIALHADVDMGVPIPVPGKGENSWDCGDDATHSMWLPATSVPEAISKVAADAMRTRERYASATWQPSDGWPKEVVE